MGSHIVKKTGSCCFIARMREKLEKMREMAFNQRKQA